MRLLRRVLITAAVTLVLLFTVVRWMADVGLTFWAVRKVPGVAYKVPENLKDHTVSQVPGMRLSYVGYDFEVPWKDLDESKTQLRPKDKPEKTMALLTFRSGLELYANAFPAGEVARLFTTDFKLSPKQFEQWAGNEAARSDYIFWGNLYNFTPNKMHYWAWSTAVHAHEMMELTLKSVAPSKAADTGIFQVQNDAFKGFQQGDPQARPDRLLVTLYSDGGNIEIMLSQKKCKVGITQPEINRMVQTLHRSSPGEVAIATK